jgi:hypothetical protein
LGKWIILLPARSRKGTSASLKTIAYTKDGIVMSFKTQKEAEAKAKDMPGAKVEEF